MEADLSGRPLDYDTLRFYQRQARQTRGRRRQFMLPPLCAKWRSTDLLFSPFEVSPRRLSSSDLTAQLPWPCHATHDPPPSLALSVCLA
jgi:hypothetical protein